VYSDPAQGGASGIHFARVLERLGIASQMRAKTKLVAGPGAAEAVARGEAEIAVSQTMGLLGVAGVEFVGPLPPELQNAADFVFMGGVGARARQPEAAKALIQFLSGPKAAAVFRTKGMEPGSGSE
jgi:molybdate transport system substrate-binding protein